jgi:hypothetical protein
MTQDEPRGSYPRFDSFNRADGKRGRRYRVVDDEQLADRPRAHVVTWATSDRLVKGRCGTPLRSASLADGAP